MDLIFTFLLKDPFIGVPSYRHVNNDYLFADLKHQVGFQANAFLSREHLLLRDSCAWNFFFGQASYLAGDEVMSFLPGKVDNFAFLQDVECGFRSLAAATTVACSGI